VILPPLVFPVLGVLKGLCRILVGTLMELHRNLVGTLVELHMNWNFVELRETLLEFYRNFKETSQEFHKKTLREVLSGILGIFTSYKLCFNLV
jgi:hypothetical protein